MRETASTVTDVSLAHETMIEANGTKKPHRPEKHIHEYAR